jgi:hypothetical protein
MCWVGAVMSACGFTWCYLSFLPLTAHYFGWLSDEQAQAALSLGYILLLPFLLFAGYAPPTYNQAAPETTTPVINTTCFWGPAPGTEILVNERSTDSMARDMLPLPPPTFGVGAHGLVYNGQVVYDRDRGGALPVPTMNWADDSEGATAKEAAARKARYSAQRESSQRATGGTRASWPWNDPSAGMTAGDEVPSTSQFYKAMSAAADDYSTHSPDEEPDADDTAGAEIDASAAARLTGRQTTGDGRQVGEITRRPSAMFTDEDDHQDEDEDEDDDILPIPSLDWSSGR